jgi:hypothetical protein
MILEDSQKEELLGLLRSGSGTSEGSSIMMDGVPDEGLSHRYAERATAVTGEGAFAATEALWERQPLLLLGDCPSVAVDGLNFLAPNVAQRSDPSSLAEPLSCQCAWSLGGTAASWVKDAMSLQTVLPLMS